MPTFIYKAVDQKGKNHKGSIDSDTEKSAIFALKAQGLIPLSISLTSKKISENQKQSHMGTSSFNENSGPENIIEKLQSIHIGPQNVSSSNIAAVIRQLATLIKAGLPVDKALKYLGEQCANEQLRQCLSQIKDNIRTGKSLADSMAEFPQFFSQTFVTMIRAGEEAGTLELVIERYADHMEQQVALKRKIQSALAYPVFMLFVGTAIIIFLLVYVIPQVTGIFADMGKILPLPTRILLGISQFVRSFWWIIALLAAGFAFLFYRLKKSRRGKLLWHGLRLKLPLVAETYRYVLVSQLTRTLGMLLKNGVTLLKALKIVHSITDNVIMTRSVQNMIDGVQEGHDISAYMNEEKLFPGIARNMVAAGEKSGNLSDMLLWVADDCENAVANKIQILTSLLEPIMILILGGFVGFVVIAIMLPIFEMSSLAG